MKEFLVKTGAEQITAPRGRWKPGQSGNPSGRKPGTGTIQQLRVEIEAHVPRIISALADKAMSGDVGAARLLLERSIPPLKPTEAPQTLTFEGSGLAEQARAIVASAAAGEITGGQAAQFVTALGTLAKLVEVDELEHRIRSLEASLEAQHEPKSKSP